MKTIITILILLQTAHIIAVQAQTPKGQEEQALAAAAQWASLIDAGNYQQAYDQTALFYRHSIPFSAFEDMQLRVQQNMGMLQTRKQLSSTLQAPPAGAPKGIYINITYENSYSKPSGVVQQFAKEYILMAQATNNRWQVAGYLIQ